MVQIAERKENFLGFLRYDAVEDYCLYDYWMRNLDKLYWETRVYSPDGGWPVI